VDKELELAIGLAHAAGGRILEIYRGAFEVVDKADGQGPVTRADHEADELIRRGIAAAFPDDAILSEETPDDLSRLGRTRLWLVDPLDGTRQFVERIDEFAVMIGLALEGEAVLGVVHLPAERLTFAGTVPGGAFELRGGTNGERRTLELPAWAPERSRPVIAISRFNASTRTQRVAKRLGPGRVLTSGSVGRKAMLVASGRADVYVSLGRRSRHWDACAPDAIVRAAGGHFGDATGRKMRYNTPDTRNDDGLIACRRGLEPALLRAASAERASGP
jgi:3'(2'), 5'-bisphosphate nucleotidase